MQLAFLNADHCPSWLPMVHIDVIQFRPAWWLPVLLLIVGCADRSVFRPNLPNEAPPPFSASGEEATPSRWWTAFDDPILNYQIEQALGGNYSLVSAQNRVRAARALARREASDLFADVNGIVGLSSTFGPGEDRTTFDWGLDAAYPVDLWGEIESRVNAERLRADATDLDYHAVALNLSTEITRTWFSLIEAHAQVKLLDDQIETNRTGSEIQEARFSLGLIRSADVLRQRQLLESTLEQSVVAKGRIEVLEHQLAVLLGEMPQTASYEPGTELPKLPPLPKTGLPAELLNRRPDVRRDYVAFQAADYDLASAISAQYPRLSLGGSLLNVAERPESVLRDWFVSVGGQLIAPLLDGGQRRAEVDRTSAVVGQLFYEYAQTMLDAFAEVEDSLALEKYQLERIEHLQNQVKLAGQSSEQLREQYLIGDVEYLDVLSAMTGQQSLQRQTLSAQLNLVLIRVTLYRALAGDFDTRPQPVSRKSNVVQEEPVPILDFEEFEEMQNLPDSNSREESLPETDSNE
jgi:outer membrane protein, multidrug efflux system